MERDRKKISKVVAEMLNHPKGVHTEVLNQLERYIEDERMQAVGWSYAEACVIADSGEDIRKTLLPAFAKRAVEDLDLPLEK